MKLRIIFLTCALALCLSANAQLPTTFLGYGFGCTFETALKSFAVNHRDFNPWSSKQGIAVFKETFAGQTWEIMLFGFSGGYLNSFSCENHNCTTDDFNTLSAKVHYKYANYLISEIKKEEVDTYERIYYDGNTRCNLLWQQGIIRLTFTLDKDL